jgi:hypothetical protein
VNKVADAARVQYQPGGTMKVIIIGIAATIILAYGASFVLDTVQKPVSERYTAADSVRLSN